MARARLIKQGFFTNDDLGSLSPLTRLLFAGLWVLADKEGRLLDRPQKIKADVLPYDHHFDVAKALRSLEERGFIIRYTARSGIGAGEEQHRSGIGAAQEVIQITKWHDHQSPHPKELASVLPPPNGVVAISNSNGSAALEPLPDHGVATAEHGLSNGSTTAEPGLVRARSVPSVPSSSLASSSLASGSVTRAARRPATGEGITQTTCWKCLADQENGAVQGHRGPCEFGPQRDDHLDVVQGAEASGDGEGE